MLVGFESWPDVFQHVRSGGIIYYVPNDSLGPHRMIARVRPSTQGDTYIWLRQPEYMAHLFPSMIADSSFTDKLYRWQPGKPGH